MAKKVKIPFEDCDFDAVPSHNIFRVGDEYASLRPGDKIDATTQDGEVVCELEVFLVEIGPLYPLSLLRAEENHEVREQQRLGQIDINPFAGPAYIRSKLDRLHGQVLPSDTVCTVITFRTSDTERDN